MKAGLVLLLALIATAPGYAQSTITGNVTDTSGTKMPGVEITVTGADYRRVIVTDLAGTYQVTGLTPGTYSVRATLAGFCPARPHDVALAAGQSLDANFTLLVAPPAGPLWVEMDAPYYWRHADFVVHLRVDGVLETKGWPAQTCGTIACTSYRATVLSVAKRHPESGPDGATVTFLQDYVGAGESAYGNNDEFVAFLSWNPTWGMFVRSGGPASLLPVRNGRVVDRSPQDININGLTVEDFLATLRTPGSGKQ